MNDDGLVRPPASARTQRTSVRRGQPLGTPRAANGGSSRPARARQRARLIRQQGPTALRMVSGGIDQGRGGWKMEEGSIRAVTVSSEGHTDVRTPAACGWKMAANAQPSLEGSGAGGTAETGVAGWPEQKAPVQGTSGRRPGDAGGVSGPLRPSKGSEAGSKPDRLAVECEAEQPARASGGHTIDATAIASRAAAARAIGDGRSGCLISPREVGMQSPNRGRDPGPRMRPIDG
ncbi:hypothetical protein OJF2_22210 [Aquisphaera giovannonii]|uniref:Uncharacterized protein n=1 Tax=Aquisphaera giovannonii TaxID=406548 RepID=A0A5B9W148_9BACT|nr:hypothetical protein OJF2_22210 [Aquisphaera giovannonii]